MKYRIGANVEFKLFEARLDKKNLFNKHAKIHWQSEAQRVAAAPRAWAGLCRDANKNWGSGNLEIW